MSRRRRDMEQQATHSLRVLSSHRAFSNIPIYICTDGFQHLKYILTGRGALSSSSGVVS